MSHSRLGLCCRPRSPTYTKRHATEGIPEVELVSLGVFARRHETDPTRWPGFQSMFVLSAELCRSPVESLSILRISVRCCAARARSSRIQQRTGRRVSASNSASCHDATGAAPTFRFASSCIETRHRWPHPRPHTELPRTIPQVPQSGAGDC